MRENILEDNFKKNMFLNKSFLNWRNDCRNYDSYRENKLISGNNRA